MKNHNISLKPCPFCGGNAEVKKCHHSKKYYVRCTECGVETSHQLFDRLAIDSWNNRLHSKWELRPDGATDCMYCKNCGFGMPINNLGRYCPHCGYKMSNSVDIQYGVISQMFSNENEEEE